MYSWSDVAKRTERVYMDVMELPRLTLAERLERYNGCGLFAGKVGAMIIAVHYMIWLFLECVLKRDAIDPAPLFDQDVFRQVFNSEQLESFILLYIDCY